MVDMREIQTANDTFVEKFVDLTIVFSWSEGLNLNYQVMIKLNRQVNNVG